MLLYFLLLPLWAHCSKRKRAESLRSMSARSPLSMSAQTVHAPLYSCQHGTGCTHPSIHVSTGLGAYTPLSMSTQTVNAPLYPCQHRTGCIHPSSFGRFYKAVWKKLRHGDRTGLAHSHRGRECGKQNSPLTKRKPKFWIYLFHYMLFKLLSPCI